MMRRFYVIAMAGFLLASSGKTVETIDTSDLMSDTWVATDALGRQMPLVDSVGRVKTDHQRVTGIFYITWHGAGNHNLPGPYTDVTKILAEDPSARLDANHPLWKYGGYHWGEPEMGYFLSQDEWVMRKDLSMLQDAGVDVLILDVTNGVCYWDEWELLFSTMRKVREEGNRTPQFVFWSYNNNPVKVVKSLYEKYYKEGKYSDLWFYWDGKPLLLYNADPSVDATGNFETTAADYPPEIFDFFTLRNMWWGYYEWGKDHEHGPDRYVGTEDNWSFGYSMDDERVKALSPEELASKHNGKVEECAVTPAQHSLGMKGAKMGVGKSWSVKTGEPSLNEYDMPIDGTSGKGIYFQERWEDALAVDPPFIYLNDWNEWTAGKYHFGDTWFMGRENSPYAFVDQYNAEFNRTIQPMKDGYTDNYYMQMAQNIRRYKGVRPIPMNKGLKKIKVDGSFSDWDKVKVTYRDTRGDITFRDGDGYAGLHYSDSTGRNDIQDSKVALGKDGNVYFYVKCGSDISPCTDPDWMLLLIDSDQDSGTGWYGYDILVGRKVSPDGKMSVMEYDSGAWKEVCLSEFAVSGKEMEIAVPVSALGISGKKAVSFDFKWADNTGELKDPISLCLHGDTAPNRRFNYRFIWNK